MKTRKKSLVIAGFAGVGKTTLAKKYKNVIDLESSPFKYDYSKYEKVDYEKLKGNKNRVLNTNYPQNYIDAIYKAKEEYDIVLVQVNDFCLELYRKISLDFVVSYPTKRSLVKIYRQKYEERGNSKEWIDNVIAYYDKLVTNNLKHQKIKKFILRDDQTLEDYLKKKNIKLIPKE